MDDTERTGLVDISERRVELRDMTSPHSKMGVCQGRLGTAMYPCLHPNFSKHHKELRQ
jgi:hypothetical protein